MFGTPGEGLRHQLAEGRRAAEQVTNLMTNDAALHDNSNRYAGPGLGCHLESHMSQTYLQHEQIDAYLNAKA